MSLYNDMVAALGSDISDKSPNPQESESSGDSNVSLEPHDDSDDFFEDMVYKKYDLVALEKHQDQKPLYTRQVLERAAEDIKYILTEQAKPSSQRGNSAIYYPQADGKEIKIWKARNKIDNMVLINYMTRVELIPEFRHQFGNTASNLSRLFTLNSDLTDAEKLRIHAPYGLSSCLDPHHITPEHPSRMKAMRTALTKTQRLWEKSSSRKEICTTVLGGAKDATTPITKILCMGLGRLQKEPAWHGSTLQHLCVFSLANKLDALNKEKNPACPPVSIIAQDPCYKHRDRIVLPELAGRPVDFSLTNPEALLAIDQNTLVVTAYLPTSVPLMQIIADLFCHYPEKGPAMMLCDQVPLDVGRRLYAQRDRGSPLVARWLRDAYVKWMQNFGDLDEEVRKAVDPARERKGKYWLTEMRLFRRQK